MLKLLLPVDDSEHIVGRVDSLTAWLSRIPVAVEVHLLNVQPSVSGDVGLFISGDQIRDYQRDEGQKALAPARAKLEMAKVPYVLHIGVGEPATNIVQFAEDNQCDQIVMGPDGLGNLSSLFSGSVTARVVQETDIPVLIMK